MNVIYGQLITGAPGSGKTTFIKGMYQFLKLMGRDPLIINLDPANVLSDYPSSVSLPSLISLDIAMQTTDLGPNGGMLYCLEYLNENIDWLIDQIEELHPQYVLIDCPGQTELFTTHDVLPTILVKLAKINCRLTAVHLIDSLHISNPSTYMAAILQGLACNMNMELPFIPFLSKADLLSSYGLDIRLINYCSGDIEDILFDVPERFEKLSKGLARVIDDYSLVKPVPLNVEDKDDMALAVALIDKANGYCFTSAESSVMSYFSVGSGSSIQLKMFEST